MNHPCPTPDRFARMSNHTYWAARFEAEGFAAYPARSNPYNPGTMAATRWETGFEKAADHTPAQQSETAS